MKAEGSRQGVRCGKQKGNAPALTLRWPLQWVGLDGDFTKALDNARGCQGPILIGPAQLFLECGS